MTEQPNTSGAPSPAPEVDVDPGTPHVEQPPAVQVPEGTKESGRFSAYDTTYAKYVGGVHDTKEKARKAAKDAGSTDVEIVEV